MMSPREAWDQIMATCEEFAANGACSCQALPHLRIDGLIDVETEVLEIAVGVATYSPDERSAMINLGHFIHAVIALGYSLGVDATTDTLMADGSTSVYVPDDLSEIDALETPAPGDRPTNK